MSLGFLGEGSTYVSKSEQCPVKEEHHTQQHKQPSKSRQSDTNFYTTKPKPVISHNTINPDTQNLLCASVSHISPFFLHKLEIVRMQDESTIQQLLGPGSSRSSCERLLESGCAAPQLSKVQCADSGVVEDPRESTPRTVTVDLQPS